MPRYARTGELTFDPKIEKTARRLRKETREYREVQSATASSGINLPESSTDRSSDSEEEVSMANNRTLRELAAPELTQ